MARTLVSAALRLIYLLGHRDESRCSSLKAAPRSAGQAQARIEDSLEGRRGIVV